MYLNLPDYCLLVFTAWFSVYLHIYSFTVDEMYPIRAQAVVVISSPFFYSVTRKNSLPSNFKNHSLHQISPWLELKLKVLFVHLHPHLHLHVPRSTTTIYRKSMTITVIVISRLCIPISNFDFIVLLSRRSPP